MNDINLFREYFKYVDGHIYWIKPSGTRGKLGTMAGKLRKDGYYDVGLKGKYYLVHRIIFALHYGYLPENIDHIDHDRKNNLIDNLREATPSQNNHNSRKSSNNTSGVKGIRITKNGMFEARLGLKNKTIQVGTFRTLNEAKYQLDMERRKWHGEYSCCG